jgi:hypothetical protein
MANRSNIYLVANRSNIYLVIYLFIVCQILLHNEKLLFWFCLNDFLLDFGTVQMVL